MTMDIERLKELCEEEDLRYFLDPRREAVMMGFGGIFGRYQIIVPIEVDGRFVQFRTVNYLHCPDDHSHIEVVLRILGERNYRLRMVKFGWDPSDGEIVAFADVWVEDGEMTQKQFSSTLKSLVTAIDMNSKRITEAMETGEDPGDPSPQDLMSSSLPDELRKALEGILDGKPSDDDDDDEPGSGFGKV
jgi:hypothetical protein